ncbi:MAG TPA: diacylglycerol kinase family protein [Dehalococcoidia bacterium]|nr:diacylglycerol kinase family protein [Dehalococcoidia bacterium]
MPNIQLIVNPMAGAGKTVKLLPSIKDILNNQGLDYDCKITEAPGHAVFLAQDAVKNGYKIIISAGGDGTINEIVNGINNANGLNSISLGIISIGTGADYIRTVGIPRYYMDACKKFSNPVTKKVDIGLVEYCKNNARSSRLFVNFAGLGFDAEIVKRTTMKYKSLGKVSAYLLALFTTLVAYKNKNVTLQINSDKHSYSICTVIMGNGKYGGGGMMTTPGASVQDGLLDVLIVGNLSKFDLLKSLPTIYNGTHLSHPKVILKQAVAIEVNSELDMPIQADGEIIGETPARFSVLPSALNLIV